jgi:2-(1,2-epoxy-1,2-dihydrophenyl)acetyl-CoA isomerase
VWRYAAATWRCATTDPLFSIDDRGPVRHLTLRRPATRNAIPGDGWQALADGFVDFESSPQRILVIAGEGGDFSSGADLGDALDDVKSTVGNHRRMKIVGEMAIRLHRLSKPTIAVVDGVAVGAGMNLAIGCDIVIGTPRARFAELFVRRGLTMDAGGSWLLPRLVGELRARELALTGRIIEAEEAAAIGLITRLVDEADLDATIAEYVDALLAGAPLAQRFLKTGLDRSTTMTFEQALAWESQAQSILLAADDFTEAVDAFNERRPPDFTGS